MPDFKYSGVKNGKRINGVIAAPTEDDARSRLSGSRVWIFKIKEQANSAKKWAPFQKGVSRRDVLDILYQWKSMLKGGIPVLDVLRQSATDSSSASLKEFIYTAVRRIEVEGKTLGESIEGNTRIFDTVMINMIKKGEESGTLVESIDYLIDYYQWLDKLNKDINKAMISPAINAIVMTGLICLLVGYVLPIIIKVLNGLHIDLPVLTIVVMYVGTFLVANWIYIVGVIGLTLSVFVFLMNTSNHFAVKVHRSILTLPVVGRIVMMVMSSRFAHNLAGLYRSGVPIIDGISMTMSAINNLYMKEQARKVVKRIESGESVSSSFSAEGMFTPMVRRMISTGEASGNMSEALQIVSDYYDVEVPRVLGHFIALIEPLVVIFFGGLMLVVVLSFFIPIYGMIGKFIS